MSPLFFFYLFAGLYLFYVILLLVWTTGYQRNGKETRDQDNRFPKPSRLRLSDLDSTIAQLNQQRQTIQHRNTEMDETLQQITIKHANIDSHLVKIIAMQHVNEKHATDIQQAILAIEKKLTASRRQLAALYEQITTIEKIATQLNKAITDKDNLRRQSRSEAQQLASASHQIVTQINEAAVKINGIANTLLNITTQIEKDKHYTAVRGSHRNASNEAMRH